MQKIIKIDGMSCQHCAKRVENALLNLKQVKFANVNLETKEATIKLVKNIADEEIIKAIEELDYKVLEIK